MATLHLKFKLRLDDSDGQDYVPHGPLFHKWLPDGETDAIILDSGDSNHELKVWFERHGYLSDYIFEFNEKRREIDDRLIPFHAKLDAGPLFGILKIKKLKGEYLEPLSENRMGDVWYKALGKKVINILYPSIAKFIDILRTNYGQYWICELEKWDSRRRSLGNYCKFVLHLEWSLDGEDWHPFVPKEPLHTLSTEINLREIASESAKYLTKRDWNELETVAQDYKPSLAAFLLSRAHQLSDQGKLREAFIEGVTSLDVALDEFFEHKIPKDKENPIRKNYNIFHEQGMPVKLTLMLTLLGKCSLSDIEKTLKAIKTRNSIVHDGFDPLTIEGTKLINVKDELSALLNSAATLLSGPKFRFPKLLSGNLVGDLNNISPDVVIRTKSESRTVS